VRSVAPAAAATERNHFIRPTRRPASRDKAFDLGDLESCRNEVNYWPKFFIFSNNER
jgi:hypothetical protein